ncbi:MAG: hypothetical protein LBH06_04865 [Rikenellaceae bacterium]|jgi:hypothetical protein|nr:hypothetical protein [Rikenellaceae bacterium]
MGQSIAEIISLAKKHRGILEQLQKLTPYETDLDKIPMIYGAIIQNKGSDVKSTAILAIVFLFSPRSIETGVLRHELKLRLSRAMGGLSVRSVNYRWEKAIFFYEHYSDFRNTTDAIILNYIPTNVNCCDK